MNIKELLETASNAQASDIFLVAGFRFPTVSTAPSKESMT